MPKIYTKILALLLLTMSVWSCREAVTITTPSATGTAKILILHASPDATPTVAVATFGANQSDTLRLDTAIYGSSALGYRDILAGVRPILVRQVAPPRGTLATGWVNLNSANSIGPLGAAAPPILTQGLNYTTIIVDSLLSSDNSLRGTALTFLDDLTPNPDSAKVRFIHASPNAAPNITTAGVTSIAPVDIRDTISRAFLFRGRAFVRTPTNDIARFIPVRAGNVVLEVRPTTNNRIDSSSIVLEGGGRGYQSAPTIRFTGTNTVGFARINIATGAIDSIGLGAVASRTTSLFPPPPTAPPIIIIDSNGTGAGVNGITGNTSAGDTILYNVSTTNGIREGHTVAGVGIPNGTRVRTVLPSSTAGNNRVVISLPATLNSSVPVGLTFGIQGAITAGSRVITGLSSRDGLFVGQLIGGNFAPPGTIIDSISTANNTITLSNPATRSVVLGAASPLIQTFGNGATAKIQLAGSAVIPGVNNPVLTTPQITLQAGKIYTIYARGLGGVTSGPQALSATVIVHNP
jgi:hypothetical protein